MALRHAILATLEGREASGYDLSKRFALGVANYWTATRQQLYRELERMEAEGLVAARRVEQERRPTKRVYSLTDAGREEILRFSRQAPRAVAIRDELLVQVETIDAGDPRAVLESILDRRAMAEAKVAAYSATGERMRGGMGEEDFLRRGDRVGPYLTLLRGIAFETENLRWCDLAIEVIAAREVPHDLTVDVPAV